MELVAFPSTEAQFRACCADEDQCRAYLARLKWPEGFCCAHCGGATAYFLPSKRVVYECAGCGRQVSLIAGTIFEQSKKPFALWFRAIFEVTASKQGISAAELHRKLGLGSYQTAWSWLQKIRGAMVRPNRQPLSGEVEIDESYVGGPEPGKPGRGAEEKAIAHKILVSAYRMLTGDLPYRELGETYLDRLTEPRVTYNLTRRLRALGYEVTLTKAA